jgi:hypothetical protein
MTDIIMDFERAGPPLEHGLRRGRGLQPQPAI